MNSILASHSLRITAPLRWFGHQARLVRQHGWGIRFKALIKKIVRHVLTQERVSGAGEITVCVAGDKEIRKLNKTFLGKDRPTDVIAFNLGGDGRFCADIIVSTETAIANAGEFRTGPHYELTLYVIHGVLHILGYDDKTPTQRKKMHKRELRLLTECSERF